MLKFLSEIANAFAKKPEPKCTCDYIVMGGGPYMSEHEERIDSPGCLVHHGP